MANFNLTATRKFPEGTVVGAYPVTNWPAGPQRDEPSGAPQGSATATATVTNGVAAFTGLTAGATYFFVAQVAGTYQYVLGTAGEDLSPTAQETVQTSQAGTLAARPSAVGNAGLIYFATDDNGGTAYRSDGTTWTAIAPGVSTPSGVELGYASISTDFTTTSTVAVDITGLSVTVTVGTRPVVVKFTSSLVTNNNATGAVNINFVRDATSLRNFYSNHKVASAGDGMMLEARDNPAAGSHTYKMQVAAVTAGTATIGASAGGLATIQVVTV